MKRFVVIIYILFVNIGYSETVNLNWYVDGNVYQTTTCTVGGDVILPTQPSKIGYTFQGWQTQQQIEYIQSTNQEYIVIDGYKPNNDTRVVAFIRTPDSASKHGWLTNVRDLKRFGVLIFSSNEANKIRFDYNTSISILCTSTQSIVDKNIIIDFNNDHKAYVYDENNNTLCTSNLNTGTWQSTLDITLGSNLSSGEFGFLQDGLRIYYFKIYTGNTLVHDLIPVLDYNDVPCMYDKITERYFYNSGTGNFIAGPIVNE